MRRLFLLVSISLLAGSYAAHAQAPGYQAPPPPTPYGSTAPAPGYKDLPPQAPYAGGKGTQLSSSENCGTPDEPKRCPPMPRHPLQHYPANKQ